MQAQGNAPPTALRPNRSGLLVLQGWGLQVNVHRNRLVVAGRARHEVQAQLLIAAVLRTGFAAELRDREQAHFERFQRSVHIDALVGGQRNRDVAPSVSEIHIERRRAVTPANAEQIAHREKRMRSDEHVALPARDVDPYHLAMARLHAAGCQLHEHAGRFQHLAQDHRMLLRQNFGRRHQRCLETVPVRHQHRRERHDRLS